MSESLIFTPEADRVVRYRELLPQIEALISGEADQIANLANVAAALKEVFGFFWVGFYLAKDSELVLGPFQGPIACTRIKFDKGVCGHSYTSQKTIIVPDVEKFPGHIACSSATRSEIVVPLFDANGNIYGVLDVDSDQQDDFDQTDADGLGSIAKLLAK